MLDQALQAHYRPPLTADALLERVGRSAPGPLRTRDLAPIDQLHLGGVPATLALLNQSRLGAEDRVLDVGCGLGGSSRLIAEQFGCRVTGLDLSPDFTALAGALNQLLETPPPVSFLAGNALAMPFFPASFDVLLSQHCIMNIPDTPGLLREFQRVLKPGGRLLLHELVQGEGGEPYYPVPWAKEAGLSFLTPRPTLEAELRAAGFKIRRLNDISHQALAWRTRHMGKEQSAENAPTLTPELVLGSDFPLMSQNLWRNLKEDRVRVLEGILVREN